MTKTDNLLAVIALWAVASLSVRTAQAGPAPTKPAADADVPMNVNAVLASHCISCHGETKPKGKVRLS